ncbi:MAG: FtsK/SpoIIIE domain-containing protein [Ilumatobacteraceae bacterium]
MDLVVSTAQGDVEMSVNDIDESVTVYDLLQPLSLSQLGKVVYIDGVATLPGTLVSASGMVNGSVVSLGTSAVAADDSPVTLVQVAGEGGGARCPLEPGRYAVGPAQRANVSAMSRSAVMGSPLQLTVGHDGAVGVVVGRDDHDGRTTVDDTPAAWMAHQYLRVGTRVFRIDPRVDDAASFSERPASGELGYTPASRVRQDSAPLQGVSGRRRSHRGRAATTVPMVASGAGAGLSPDSAAGTHSSHVDVGEVVRRAMTRSARLWERGVTDDDSFTFSVGLADERLSGPVGDAAFAWSIVPVVVDLASVRGVAFVGSSDQARAAARALVLQACVAHRPADLDVVVLASSAGASRWEWIKWLPHARSSAGAQLFSDNDSISDWLTAQRTLTTVIASVQALDRPIAPSRLTLVVVDDPTLWSGRSAMLRGLFADSHLPVRFIAVAERSDSIPAVCSTVMTIEANGAAVVDSPISGSSVSDVVPFVLDHDMAVAAARRMSPLVDDAAPSSGRAPLPTRVSLVSLIDPDGLDPRRLADRWQSRQSSRRLRFPLGVGSEGTVELDLIEDGPNVLIVGDPRAGKTETLCNLLAGVLLSADPSSVTAVTVEANPSRSFDELAGLVHMAGRIRQFSERGGARLIRSLRAEVSRRKEILNDREALSLTDYNALADSQSLARLVIAVDDADIILRRSPRFVGQLVELTARSQHLGLHLVIAGGQFSKAFQNVVRQLNGTRIALRMHDSAEAVALVGSREPLHLSPQNPGRALVVTRTAPIRPVHVAALSEQPAGLFQVMPFVIARGLSATERRLGAARPGNTAVLARSAWFRSVWEAVREAHCSMTSEPVRPVLCTDLPSTVTFDELAVPSAAPFESEGVEVGFADLPDSQRVGRHLWNPAVDGNVAVIGGTTTERSEVLATFVLAAGCRYSSTQLLTYVIDASSANEAARGSLTVAEGLPNCAGAVATDDPDRVVRLLSHLGDEVDRRSADADQPPAPHLVLMVDDLGALLRELEFGGGIAGEPALGYTLLSKIIADGPSRGVSTVMTAAGEAAAPSEMLGQFHSRLMLGLDDQADYSATFIEPSHSRGSLAGRAIALPGRVEVQLAVVSDLAAAVSSLQAAAVVVPTHDLIPLTPTSIRLADIIDGARHDEVGWTVPIGLEARSLRSLTMTLPVGEGALIVGDAGTGRSALLEVVTRGIIRAKGAVEVHALARAHRPLLDLCGLARTATAAEVGALVDAVLSNADREQVIIVDDTDLPDDPALHRLAAAAGGVLSIVVAGRARWLDDPGHWTAPLRRFRTGVLLRPLAGDGVVFGLQISSSATQTRRNRALLVQHGATTPVLLVNEPTAVSAEP